MYKLRKNNKFISYTLLFVLLFVLPFTSISFGSAVSDIDIIEVSTSIVIEEPFLAAALQFNPQLNERDGNIENLIEIVTEAAENGAKLIVTPEMATTGYKYADRNAIEPFLDTVPGVTTEKFEKIAKEYETYIVLGMAEVDPETDLYYVTAALIGPEGYIGKYRKSHLWETETHWAAWGDVGVPVYDTSIGKIAINICMDSTYFEGIRLAALQGANILAFPTNSSGQAIWHLEARAEQNGLYIVSANRSNTEDGFGMKGASAIWSPQGKKLVEAEFVTEEDIDGPTIIYAEIDPSQYKNEAKELLKNRRPELYKELMLYKAPWDYTKTTSSQDITAAALQYQPLVENKRENIEKIEIMLQEAALKAKERNEKLDLVVLPELSTTGVVKNIEKINNLAESLEGSTVAIFKEMAKEYQVYIVFGMIEKENDALYNTAIIMDPNGDILGRYRKTHLNEWDKAWATEGNELPVFSTELGNIGIMIGSDGIFPEVAGVLAVKRADFIVIPSSWGGEFGKEIEINRHISVNPYPSNAITTWDSIAMTAQAYTIVSNFIGTEEGYLGGSGLYTLDPLYGLDQPVIASKDKEEVFFMRFSTLQNEWWLNQEKVILSRRVHLYNLLIQ